MKAAVIIISAVTAFCITAGGAMIVVIGSKNTLNKEAIALACVLGVVAAAKDTRSLLRLPPINGNGNGNGDSTNGVK